MNVILAKTPIDISSFINSSKFFITDMLFPMFKNAKAKHKLLTGMPPFALYRDNWGQYPLDKSKKIILQKITV